MFLTDKELTDKTIVTLANQRDELQERTDELEALLRSVLLRHHSGKIDDECQQALKYIGPLDG